MRKLLAILPFLLVVLLFGWQQHRTNRLEHELAALRARTTAPTESTSTEPAITRPGETIVQRVPMDATVYHRLESLEQQVGTLAHASDYLMEQGRVPLTGAKTQELVARLGDSTSSDKDRLSALNLLRRANSLDDAGLYVTMNWLNSSTNAGLRRNILRRLEGMTNSVLQSSFLQLALNEPEVRVRTQAIDNLGRFVADPNVEAQLWQIATGDEPSTVRRQAMRALQRGTLSETRIAGLQRMALDSSSDLDDRLFALSALRGNQTAIPTIMNSLAEEAFQTQDPHERARLFQVFDGYKDESLKVPLVYGLEDPNPTVREHAADALSSYQDDPTVREWLNYVAENDADPRVRREAFRALDRRR